MLEHADWLRGLTRSLVRDGAEAEDVLQDTLLAAGDLPTPNGVAERSWLAGIARNLARNRRTREARLKRRERDVSRGEATAASALDDAALIERQRGLLANVESLPEDQRRVILMRFYDGLPPRKIAAAEGLPVAEVHRRIQRGLETLRKELDSAYGDRRTWAAWAAPLGGAAPKAQGVTAVVAVALAAVMVAGWGAWSLLATPGVPSTDPGLSAAQAAALSGLESSSSPLPSANTAKLAAVDATSAPMRAEAEAPASTGYSVQVLFNGAPAAGAQVIALSAKILEEDPELLFEMEPTIWNQGVHGTADVDGRCDIDLEPPFLVRASNEKGLAHYGFDGSEGSATMELERAARLTVRVLDRDGQQLDEANSEGLRVTAFTTLKDVYDSSPGGEEDSRGTATHRLINGLASFQNPWFYRSINGITASVENWSKASIDAVALAIPGAPEFVPVSVSAERFLPFKKQVGVQERTLTMPPTGKLRIQIHRPDGELDPGNGSVTLRFNKPPARHHYVASYETSVAAGVAEFPAVVVGSHPFELTVNLPEEGATWTLSGVTPEHEGETQTLKTFRPSLPAVTARLVDESGAPLKNTSVTLNYAIAGYGNGEVDRQVRATSRPDGRVRFEIPKDEDLAAPFALVAYDWSTAGSREATTILSVHPTAVREGLELGDVKMKWLEHDELKGQVVGDEGEPLADIWVNVERPGRSTYAVKTDDKGRFQLGLSLDPGAVLTIKPESLGYLSKSVSLSAINTDEPLEIRADRGARLIVQLDFSSYPELEEWFGVKLQDEDGEYVYIHPLGGGRFQSLPLGSGPYRCSLRLPFGWVPIVVVENIEVPASGGDFSDPRIDGVRLTDYIREIKLTQNGEPFQEESGVQVRAVGQAQDRDDPHKSLIYHGRTVQGKPMPCVVPLHLASSLLIEGPDGASQLYENAQALGDTVEVTFGAKIRVRLDLLGQADPDMSYELRGEAGTRTAGASARLFNDRLPKDTDAVQAEFPMPGTYRLYRSRRPDLSSNPDGPVIAELVYATQATIEVVDEAPISLRIDAARVESTR